MGVGVKDGRVSVGCCSLSHHETRLWHIRAQVSTDHPLLPAFPASSAQPDDQVEDH